MKLNVFFILISNVHKYIIFFSSDSSSSRLVRVELLSCYELGPVCITIRMSILQ